MFNKEGECRNAYCCKRIIVTFKMMQQNLMMTFWGDGQSSGFRLSSLTKREREFITVPQRGTQCFQVEAGCRLVRQRFERRRRSRWSRAAVCLAVMQRVLVLSFNLSGIVVAPCSTPCGPTDEAKPPQWDPPHPTPRPRCYSAWSTGEYQIGLKKVTDAAGWGLSQFNSKSGP